MSCVSGAADHIPSTSACMAQRVLEMLNKEANHTANPIVNPTTKIKGGVELAFKMSEIKFVMSTSPELIFLNPFACFFLFYICFFKRHCY